MIYINPRHGFQLFFENLFDRRGASHIVELLECYQQFVAASGFLGGYSNYSMMLKYYKSVPVNAILKKNNTSQTQRHSLDLLIPP